MEIFHLVLPEYAKLFHNFPNSVLWRHHFSPLSHYWTYFWRRIWPQFTAWLRVMEDSVHKPVLWCNVTKTNPVSWLTSKWPIDDSQMVNLLVLTVFLKLNASKNGRRQTALHWGYTPLSLLFSFYISFLIPLLL